MIESVLERNLGQVLYQLDADTKKLTKKKLTKKRRKYNLVIKNESSIIFNQTCIKNNFCQNIQHTHTHIYIYIYIYREREREPICPSVCISGDNSEQLSIILFLHIGNSGMSQSNNMWTKRRRFCLWRSLINVKKKRESKYDHHHPHCKECSGQRALILGWWCICC